MTRSSFLKMALGAAVAPKVASPPEMFKVVFQASYKPIIAAGWIHRIDENMPKWRMKNGVFEKIEP